MRNAVFMSVITLLFIVAIPIYGYDQINGSPYIDWDSFDVSGDYIDIKLIQGHLDQHSGDTVFQINYNPLTTSYSRYRVGVKVSWNLLNNSAYKELSECFRNYYTKSRYFINTFENDTIINIQNRSYFVPFKWELIVVDIQNNSSRIINDASSNEIRVLSDCCCNCSENNVSRNYGKLFSANKMINIWTDFPVEFVCDEAIENTKVFTNNLKELTFWARGKTGGEISTFTIETCPNSSRTTGAIALSETWQEYSLNLEGINLTCTPKFIWATNIKQNPKGCIVYIDDIRYK